MEANVAAAAGRVGGSAGLGLGVAGTAGAVSANAAQVDADEWFSRAVHTVPYLLRS